MIGHYIEDDALDAFSLMGLINGNGNLAMTTSKSLRDFADWVSPYDVDFVLLDINRPDSRSLQKDVAIIRKHSTAPIIFITGDEAQYYREQAVLAGAQAVIEKNNLTVKSLRSVLDSVVMEKSGRPFELTSENDLIEITQQAPSAALDPGRVQIAFSYLQDVLENIANAAAESHVSQEKLQVSVKLMAMATANLSAYYTGSPTHQAGNPAGHAVRPLPAVVRSIQETALAAAGQKDVQLVFQMGVDVLEKSTSLERTQAGIRHFLLAAITGSSAGNTLSFNADLMAEGTRLTIRSQEPFNVDLELALSRQAPLGLANFGPTVAMTLAFMLLDAGPSEVTNFSRGSLHSIVIETPEN